MRRDLERFHGIDPARVVVTGLAAVGRLPPADAREAEYEALLRRLGLDPAKPVVLYAGNTPTNQPYEANYVEQARRLVGRGAAATSASSSCSVRIRGTLRSRSASLLRFDRPGAAVQEASYTDLADLATLLQHVACVVANGGTILLDGVVNDRPSVCITFDAGAPPGERWADLNLGGEHYRELIDSDALYRADDFDGLFAAIERALAHPGEHAAERRRVAREVMGEVDGRAVERVVAAIVDGLGARAAR